MNYQRKIKLEETDATGVIFFTKLQTIGLECLEIFLNEAGFSVLKMMELNYLFPIVHVEANYLSPMRLEDVLNVKLFLENIGSKSMSFYLSFEKEGQVCANMKLTNVLISKIDCKSMEIPGFIKDLFSRLPTLSVV